MAIEVANLSSPLDAASTATDASADDPLWYKDAIIYQAHVKAFFDSNNDGKGDFPGLTHKLDYLQSLGITCVWLLPFFPSPLKDDGYDIADYRSVHPSYGTLDDFTAFVRAAHERHIKVLIELVVNHTSDQHPWFQRARQAPPGSPERDFYVWSDTDTKFPDTRIIFSDAEKSNWAFDPVARQYYWHRFFSHQPDLNHNNPAVVDAVIDVMKFWLDLGVDAMRLDAVPYLCVREGTTNENLPETHAVLKRIRRELDATYRNRMLLAEANQWPADVRAYFGDGDECHMAFHFPLMPRMFMALRQEDRHAITEILNQTPDIPESCQWALFLRNHDELTLEMVTDEERDYMYSVYANDPQMRINGGIRRRLAPLVENSRRRVELLHSLLFALPGTPVIYYGDEIGMGDNIYLGDRNGVRTPMQWSSDRNAGFSRADPARLYAPPIMDPVYGYEAINVEAQERYPFSLLNWMKRLVALRRQHRVFGRGSLEFIYPTNRKVLVFLRRDDRETILVVANLSRSLQPAFLDLRQFEGMYPVEVTELTEFPRIGSQPYFLTLGPYASYWFMLRHEQTQRTQPAASVAAGAGVEALPTILMGSDWVNTIDSSTRFVLERHALRPFLGRQPWFASKGRAIRRATFSDWATLRQGNEPAFLTVVSVEYGDGSSEAYFVPLALVAGENAEHAVTHSPHTVLARITGARAGAIIDGVEDDETCDELLKMAGEMTEMATVKGRAQGVPVAGPHQRGRGGKPDADRRAATLARQWVRDLGDRTRSLAFADERCALTVFRRIEPANNPEYEIGRHLARHGFSRVPAFIGALEYHRPGLDPGTLAVVQSVVKHQGAGWQHTIDDLRRYYDRVSARISTTRGESTVPAQPTGDGPPPFFAAVEHWYLMNAALLGRRTAELHLTLARSSDPAFSPCPFDRQTLDTLATRMRTDAETSLEMLSQRLALQNDLARQSAEDVLAQHAAVVSTIDRIRGLDRAGAQIRVHGDFHLGKILRTEEDVVILDFEGEPGRPIAERRAKHSAMKDVASMMRSFGYAAYATLFTYTNHASDRWGALRGWADTWQHWVADAFLMGYRATAGDAAFVPQGDAWPAMLNAFALDRALSELRHELDHRPDWVHIPLIGISQLIVEQ